MEYYSRVSFAAADKLNTFDHVWKDVRSRSERQAGMFAALWALDTGSAVPTLQEGKSSKGVKFRNNVIHKGYLPTEDEAVSFGQGVVDIISDILGTLQRVHGTSYCEVDDANDESFTGLEVQSMHVPGIFNWPSQDLVGKTVVLSGVLQKRIFERAKMAETTAMAMSATIG